MLQAWRADWVRFVEQGFGVTLDAEQRAILRAVRTERKVSVVSGTARGKDFVAACAAMCFLYLTPRWRIGAGGRLELAENTKVAMTAPTDRQVLNIMMPEISRLYTRARSRGLDLCGKLNAYGIRMEDKEWFLTGFKADEHNHEAWSGFHAVHTMFIVTEATGISDDTFAAIEGNLQGDSRLLIVFNPNTAAGYAARSQKSDAWAKFRLNSLTAPNVVTRRQVIAGQVNYEWVKDRVDEWCEPIHAGDVRTELDDFEFEGVWYRPTDLFRRKVLGRFPKTGEDALIPLQWIELAEQRWRVYGGKQPHGDAHIIGVDVAGMGRDATVFCERRGAWVAPFDVRSSGGQADHMKVAGMIRERRRKNPAAYVSIDTIGEGAGVYSRCLETDNKAYIISCKYSEGTKDKHGRERTDSTGQHHFANMRAWLFWAVREWLDPKNDTGAMLPPDSRLKEEATEIRWSFRSDGRILIEPKEDIRKRIGRSTDRFDALANTFYPIAQHNAIDVGRIASMIGR